MRGRVTGDIAHRLLDDSEGSQLGVGCEPHLGAGHLESQTKSVGVLDIREQTADGRDQAKLGRAQAGGVPSKLSIPEGSNDSGSISSESETASARHRYVPTPWCPRDV
jgi:hypothetical protein